MEKWFENKLKKLYVLQKKHEKLLSECVFDYYELYGKEPDGDAWVDTFDIGGGAKLDLDAIHKEGLKKIR